MYNSFLVPDFVHVILSTATASGERKLIIISLLEAEMDLVSSLLPEFPSLGLDPNSQYQNVTFLQNIFISAFLGTFIANLAGQAFRGILGESAIIGHLVQKYDNQQF